MGLSDSRPDHSVSYVFPQKRRSLSLAVWPGLPGAKARSSSADLSTRAVPKHPGRSDGCSYLLLHHRSVWLHLIRQTGHLRIPIEAESGSFSLRLACSPPASPITRTHARLATMLNRQFTR